MSKERKMNGEKYLKAVKLWDLELADKLLCGKESNYSHEEMRKVPEFCHLEQLLRRKKEDEAIAHLEKEKLSVDIAFKYYDYSLITRAAFHNCFKAVKYLIDKGAKTSKYGVPPVLEVCSGLKKNSNTKMLKLLLENKADPNALYRDGHWDTPLIAAARVGNFEAVKLLLNHGADINAVNYYGDTALIIACIYNQLKVIKELLTRGADVNLTNDAGDNALINGLNEGQSFEAATLLIKHMNSPKCIKEAFNFVKKELDEENGWSPCPYNPPELIKLLKFYNFLVKADPSIKEADFYKSILKIVKNRFSKGEYFGREIIQAAYLYEELVKRDASLKDNKFYEICITKIKEDLKKIKEFVRDFPIKFKDKKLESWEKRNFKVSQLDDQILTFFLENRNIQF